MVKVLSLFDGSGCWQLAAELVGFEAKYASEIEKFPIEVTKKNFPNMIHLGDVTKVKGDEIEPCEVICAGSPCQDLSVAGKREGLKGERSGLFMEVIRIIKEMRRATNGRYPKLAIWENVPGAFSSNGGEDFRAVIEEFIHICSDADIPRPPQGKWTNSGLLGGDGYSLAWRVLDAQYWGVPQRRRRIFLVADFAGERAGKILFEREGLRRNFKKSCEKRKGIAYHPEESVGDAILYETNPTDARYKTTEVCQTLKERMGTGGGNVPLVGEAYGISKEAYDSGIKADFGFRIEREREYSNDSTECSCPSYWIDPGAHRYAGTSLENVANAVTNGTCPGWHMGVAYCIGNGQTHDALQPEEICKTLNCMDDPMKVMIERERERGNLDIEQKFPYDNGIEKCC